MMSKKPKKILTTALIAGIILTGGIITELPTTMKATAVYDKKLGYDPDAKPNIWGIHNLDDLWNEWKDSIGFPCAKHAWAGSMMRVLLDYYHQLIKEVRTVSG